MSVIVIAEHASVHLTSPPKLDVIKDVTGRERQPTLSVDNNNHGTQKYAP